MPEVLEISSVEVFEKEVTVRSGFAIVHFWASWIPQCNQMNDVFNELCSDVFYSNVLFAKVDAEALSDLSMKFKVEAVPTVLVFEKGLEVGRVNGANFPAVSKMLRKFVSDGVDPVFSGPNLGSKSVESLEDRLKALIRQASVMLFMKGSREEPRCGFSREIISIFDGQGISYETFDILKDEDVRQGLKKFSDWPTYPQVYTNGNLLGGLDIVKELVQSGSLLSEIPKNALKEPLNDRLKKLINSSPVMVFMKGSTDSPHCKFSRQLMSLLQPSGVQFSTFDILEDNEVRQALKVYSDWPTYPQVYVNGELIGGVDLIKELVDSGDLVSTLTPGH